MANIETIGHLIGLIAGIVSGIALFCGLIFTFVRWLIKQDKQSADIEALRDKHDADQEKVRDELCVISYALLAALAVLNTLTATEEVTQAYQMLQKHLNKSAHDQK